VIIDYCSFGNGLKKDFQQIGIRAMSPQEILDQLTEGEREFVIRGAQSRSLQTGKTMTEEDAGILLNEHPGALSNALMKPKYPNEAMQKSLHAFNRALMNWVDARAAKEKGSHRI